MARNGQQANQRQYRQGVAVNLQYLLEEKKRIQEHLGSVNESIQSLTPNKADLYGVILEQQKAKRKASSFIKKMQQNKQQLQEKKRYIRDRQKKAFRQRQELQIKMKQESQSIKKAERVLKLKKRRLQEQVANEMRLKVDKESNKLIKDIMSKQKKLKQMQESIQQQQIRIANTKRKAQQNNNPEINSHSQQLKPSIPKPEAILHQIIKYPKTKWDELIEQDQKAMKHALKLKSLEKKTKLQKRMQYGQLINDMYQSKIKHKTEKAENNMLSLDREEKKSYTIHVLPEIKSRRHENDQRIQKEKAKILLKSLTNPKHAKLLNYNFQDVEQSMEGQQPLKVDFMTEQIRKKQIQEKKLRNQTRKRLQKYENASLDLLIARKAKRKYHNYLGTVSVIKKPQELALEQILKNDSLSKEEKCFQLLKKSTEIENTVRLKLQSKKERKGALKLFLTNMQAKLDLLSSI